VKTIVVGGRERGWGSVRDRQTSRERERKRESEGAGMTQRHKHKQERSRARLVCHGEPNRYESIGHVEKKCVLNALRIKTGQRHVGLPQLLCRYHVVDCSHWMLTLVGRCIHSMLFQLYPQCQSQETSHYNRQKRKRALNIRDRKACASRRRSRGIKMKDDER
jgi:hypothetical protein